VSAYAFASRVEYVTDMHVAYLDLSDDPMFERTAAWAPALFIALLDIHLDAPNRRERALEALRGAA
jgi:hypothetical protein